MLVLHQHTSPLEMAFFKGSQQLQLWNQGWKDIIISLKPQGIKTDCKISAVKAVFKYDQNVPEITAACMQAGYTRALCAINECVHLKKFLLRNEL